MKGSEKQIKWAEDILANGKATITRNIELDKERLAKYGDIMFAESIEIWEQIEAEYDKIIANVTDASEIIAKRHRLSPDALIREVNLRQMEMENKRRSNK